MAISLTLATIGGDENSWGAKTNTAFTTIADAVNGTSGTIAPNLDTLTIGGTNVTSTALEINKLDGFTGTFTDLNYAKDLRATGVTTTEFDKLDGLTSTTNELNKLDGFTGTVTDLNYAKDLRATGVTTTEFNYLDGVTSNIQTQLDAAGTGSMSSFQMEDGDGTEKTISDGTEVKFQEGGGIDIDWTGLTADGSDGNPFDLTFTLAVDHRNSASVAEVKVGSQTDYICTSVNSGTQFFRGGNEEMRLEDNGNLDVVGNITAYSTVPSDQRLKHDIQKISNALEKVSQINGYTFTYNKDNKPSAGVIAQEIQQVLPSAVDDRELVFHGQEGIEYKTVQYDQLHGLLIEAIKELKAEIEELKNGSTD